MNELLTTRQVAERLAKAPGTLENWRLTGKGPRWIKIGRDVRYPASEVEKWLEENAVYGK